MSSFRGSNDSSFLRHLCEFIGDTVTIFTTSGGKSGCGFTGVLISVNPCFVRLLTKIGTPPTIPLSESICPDLNGSSKGCAFDNGVGSIGLGGHHKGDAQNHMLGSVCDIPIKSIVTFCHNAI